MNILIYHLSDLHYNENSKLNYLNQRAENIATAPLLHRSTFDVIIVLITGDIAFSGKDNEYKQAEDFIKTINEKIKKTFHITPHFELVPGNHDCVLTPEDSIRELVRKSVQNGEFNEQLLEKMTDCQSNFFSFYQRVTSRVWENKLFTERTINIEGKVIDIQLINSAWMSAKEEKAGSISIPIDQIAPKKVSTADYSITLLHHPFNWYLPAIKRHIQKRVENLSDFIFLGHEHDYSGYKKSDVDDNTVFYFEGGILQENTFEKPCSFNTLLINSKSNECSTNLYSWDEKNQIFSQSETKTFNLIPNPVRPNEKYNLTYKYSQILNDLGMAFTNPNVESIDLNQLFVYPNLRNIDKKIEAKDKFISFQNPVEILQKDKKLVILGNDKAGKSTFCKKLFVDLFENGLIPVLIDGIEIKNHDDIGFSKILQKCYTDIYSTPIYDFYSQDSINKKVLIIDNFENCRLNDSQRCTFLEMLKNRFEFIVLVGNINTTFFSYLLSTQTDMDFYEFSKYELLEFNPKKRASLIERWVKLDANLSPEEIKRKQIETERILTGLIGKNFIPSYPLFILLILQQLEASKKVDPNLGDYGYLYESLITIALRRMSNPSFTIDIQLGFLSELAYYLFRNRATSRYRGKLLLDKNHFFNFTNQYNKTQRLTLDNENTLKSFISQGILEENGDISFKYSYIFYYFVGRYFKDHLHENVIVEQIEEMCQKLHFVEFSNILIFLCYQSKDPIIADTILKQSRILFSTVHEFDVVEDSKQLTDSVNNLPDIITELVSKEGEDDFSDTKSIEPLHDQQDEESFDRDLSEALQITVAFTSINLMGLLLKNFPGTLPGETKDALAKEICSLGLRIAGYVFSTLEPTMRSFVEIKLESIRENHKDWQLDKICSKISESLVGLLETSCFICMKMITNSLGNELIDPILKQLLAENTQNQSYKFIEVSLKLDHYHRFPEREIFNLVQKIHKKPFAFYLLKYFVGYYYFVLGVDSTQRKSVSSRLGLSSSPALPAKT